MAISYQNTATKISYIHVTDMCAYHVHPDSVPDLGAIQIVYLLTYLLTYLRW